MSLFILPMIRATDANGIPLPGATLTFYVTDSLTLVDVYTAPDLGTAHSNPVEADGGGLFPPIYTDPSIIYRAILKTAAGVTVQDIDPYNESYLLAGGVSRTIADKLADTVSLLDFIPVNLHADIRARISTADVGSYIQDALDYLDGLGGGTLYVPEGLYSKSATVNLPKRVTIQGAGRKASVFRHTGNGNGFASTWPINNSTIVDINLRDFGIVATTTTSLPLAAQPPQNGSNTGHGIYEQGGSYVCIFNIWVSGFKFGITFNQTELAEIDLCLCEFQSYCNIWLVNTAGILGTEANGFTNRISISRCQLNSGTSYNIVDDGGVSHAFRDNNYNGAGQYHVRAAGVSNLDVSGGEWEGAGEGCALLTNMSAGAVQATTAVGACGTAKFDTTYFLCPNLKPGLKIESCSHLNMVSMAFTSTGGAIAAVQGMNNVNQLTESGTYYEAAINPLFDTAGDVTSRIHAETSVIMGQATYDPPSLATGAIGAETTVTVTGAALGDFVENISFSLDTQGVEFIARVSAANTVKVIPRNPTAGTIDLASGTLRAQVRRRLF